MDLMENPVQHYPWGSRVALATLQGRSAPTSEPEAELWMGAHEQAPSEVRRDGHRVDLCGCIAAEPRAEVGPAVLQEYGARLPFLLKLLAADQPLSLQVHPDTTQAQHGDWTDPWGKPELLCAVTEFHALCGLREREDALQVLLPLNLPEVAARVRWSGSTTAVVEWAMRLSDVAAGGLVARLRRTASDAARAGGPHALHHAVVAGLAEKWPGDRGVLVALLMHHVRLAPGEALYVGPGEPHTYLGGVGVEVMGNSDNVVRGGLTAKEVARDTFLETLRPSPSPTVLAGRHEAPGVTTYPAPAREFRLHQVQVEGDTTIAGGCPRLVFCLEGAARLACAEERCAVRAGQSVFLRADDGPVTATGEATLFVATPGAAAGLGYWPHDPRPGHRSTPEAQRAGAGAGRGAAARHRRGAHAGVDG